MATIRLLNVHTLELESFPRLKPHYAIASHRWSPVGESSFQDVQAKVNLHLPGYQKIQQFAAFVRDFVHDVDYLWIDTCCIDKTSSQELQEAITAMYRWYESATVCLAYLSDSPTGQGLEGLQRSVWFTRGWTLQELLAPNLVIFLSAEWKVIGHKAQENSSINGQTILDQLGPRLNGEVARITGIPETVVTRADLRRSFSVDDKLGWMAKRTTTRSEDMVYSLLGLFEVHMPLLYQEGQKAAERRLRRAIEDANEDNADHNTSASLGDTDIHPAKRLRHRASLSRDVLPDRMHSSRDKHTDHDPEMHEFLRKLYQRTYPYEDRKNRNREPVRGTCKWFADQERFRSWNSPSAHDHDDSPLLYVTADPGCGKSVLSRHLVDTVLPSEGRIVCYAFFKDDFEDQKTSMGAACALLHQFLCSQQHPSQASRVLETFKSQGDRFFDSFTAVWGTLIAATAAASDQEVVCIIDALDECREADRNQLLSKIIESSSPTLRFLLTSRPYEYITRNVRLEVGHRLSSIHIQGDCGHTADEIVREIRLVIQHRIDDTVHYWRLSSIERQLLSENVFRVPNRTYLWVTLVFDGLIAREKGITKRDILSLTTELPSGIYDAYEKLLAKSQDRVETRKLLSIVLAAERPIDLTEMAIALAYNESQKTWSDLKDDVIPDDRIREHIRDLCGLFITVVDAKVYLLHQTAREFLLQMPGSSPRDLSSTSITNRETVNFWKHSILLTDAHGLIAELCMCLLHLYLLDQDVFRGRPLHESWTETPDTLIIYCSRYWPTHYRQSSIETRTAMFELIEKLCTPSVNRARWLIAHEDLSNEHEALGADRAHTVEWLQTAPILHVTSALGLDRTVNRLLSTYLGDVELIKKIDSGDPENPTPLFWAANQGCVEVVELLLATGKVNINYRTREGLTALMCAADMGHCRVVELLLATGVANVNARCNEGASVLSYAVGSGEPKVVELLLARAEIEVTLLEVPNILLVLAASNGYKEIVALLLATGKININQVDFEGCTALHAAACFGRREIVKLLLKTHKADASLVNKNGLTALAAAQQRWWDEGTTNDKEHTAIAEMLTDYHPVRDQHR